MLMRSGMLNARAVSGRTMLISINLENLVFRDLLTFMMEVPRNIAFCTHLLFCAKNIERIGDHATNIAEMAVYLVTGESLPMERPSSRSSTPVSPTTVM